jgi:hypothetical protein
MYFLQQLAALVPGDASHEYANRPMLVELAVDENESLHPASDAPGFRLVGGELPFDKPLEVGESPIGIFKVHLRWLINRHDLRLWLFGWLLAFFSHGRLMLVTCEDAVRNWPLTGRSFCEYVGHLVVVAQHMVQLEAMELAL